MVALLLSGSAILLHSCTEPAPAGPINEETIISRLVDSMTLVSTENGRKINVFFTPLMEHYEFAKVPFQEYRKGIDFMSFNDSTEVMSSHIVADYALYWTDRDLWELKGNVVVIGENDRTLYSQQLTWDRKIKKIYSNVDSKVEENGDVFIGEGFEADDDFNRWTFRRLKGRVSVDVEPSQSDESGSGTEPVQAPAGEARIVPQPPAVIQESPSEETARPMRRVNRERPVKLLKETALEELPEQ